MGSSSSGTESVTQRSEPWSASQPYLRDIFSGAQGLYNQGSEYFPNSTVVPFHGDTEQGLQGLRDQFQGAPTGYTGATGALDRIMGSTGGGVNPYADQMQGAAGQTTQNGTGMIAGSAGANPFTGLIGATAAQQNDAGANVLNDFANTNQSNPYIDNMFNRAATQVRDNTNAMFSKAGRYGSTANQDALSDSLGDMANQFYGGAYESDANRRFGAAEALGGRQAGDINRQLGAAGQMAGLGESQYGRMAGAGSTLAGIQQGDFARQLSALGALGGYGEAGLNRGMDANQQAMQAAGLLPMMNAYGQTNNRGLMEIGGYREQMAAQQLQDQIDRWNFGQNAGWDQLGRYNATVQPLAGLGGTTTGTQPTQSRTGGILQGAAGGAMMGSAIPGVGTLIGGGLGALGGLFG